MNAVRKTTVLALAGAVVAALASGCAGPGYGAPKLSLAKVELKRADVVVLQPVEGKSNEQGYLLGLIKVIDGNKLEVLGFPFFKDQTARLEGTRGYFPCASRLESRAYYKALATAPDADAVIERSVTTEHFAVPVLYSCKTLTFQGKAVKIKPD